MLTALHRASRLAQRSRVSKPRSTDGGNRWTAASKGIDRREFPRTPNQDLYKAFTLDEHQPSRLVLGGQSVWQTLDSGATWTGISQKGLSKGANVTAVAIAPSQRETLYAATSDGRFWATFDGGTNWLERDQGLPIASGNATLDIAIDPAHPNHVFIQMTPGKAGQTRAQTVPIGDAAQGRVWMTRRRLVLDEARLWDPHEPGREVPRGGLAAWAFDAVCRHGPRCLFLE